MDEAPPTADGIIPVDEIVPVDAGPITTSIVWATWALFVGLGLLLIGAGLFATVVGIRVETDGFPTVAIGLVVAAYYFGFLVGSRLTLLALGRVGHIRVYAALASLLGSVILVAGMAVHPASWLVLRLLAGACIAGHYVVAESWLNQLATNANRARILSIYTMVTVVAFGVGQLAIGLVDPQTLTAFGVAAVLIGLAVTPVALSADASPPILAAPAKMPLRELLSIVPTGVVTSVLVGIAHGAFLGLATVYATRSGLDKAQIGLFVAMPTLGSLFLQVPISSASDEFDRRIVGALTATAAAGAATVLLVVGPDAWLGFAAMTAIGGATYPLYSISGAYTNDWIPTEQLTAAASQLVVLYGAGAFMGPFVASLVMHAVGTDGYVWTTVGTHLLIASYLTARVLQWRPSVRALPWNAVKLETRAFQPPATAVGMGRRLRVPRRRPRPPRAR